MEFRLNADYRIFSGTIANAPPVPGNIRNNSSGTQVRLYGDGRLLYTSPMISQGSIPVSFIVDVSNVNVLTIVVEAPDRAGVQSYTNTTGIVNARLER
jgi:hypothetical protein